ncbi:hypothetical protein [Streptomyces mirabilis]
MAVLRGLYSSTKLLLAAVRYGSFQPWVMVHCSQAMVPFMSG